MLSLRTCVSLVAFQAAIFSTVYGMDADEDEIPPPSSQHTTLSHTSEYLADVAAGVTTRPGPTLETADAAASLASGVGQAPVFSGEASKNKLEDDWRQALVDLSILDLRLEPDGFATHERMVALISQFITFFSPETPVRDLLKYFQEGHEFLENPELDLNMSGYVFMRSIGMKKEEVTPAHFEAWDAIYNELLKGMQEGDSGAGGVPRMAIGGVPRMANWVRDFINAERNEEMQEVVLCLARWDQDSTKDNLRLCQEMLKNGINLRNVTFQNFEKWRFLDNRKRYPLDIAG